MSAREDDPVRSVGPSHGGTVDRGLGGDDRTAPSPPQPRPAQNAPAPAPAQHIAVRVVLIPSPLLMGIRDPKLQQIVATVRSHYELLVRSHTPAPPAVDFEVAAERERDQVGKAAYGPLEFPVYLLEGGPSRVSVDRLHALMREHRVPEGGSPNWYTVIRRAWTSDTDSGAAVAWRPTPFSGAKLAFVNGRVVGERAGDLDKNYSQTIVHESVHAAGLPGHDVGDTDEEQLMRPTPHPDSGSTLKRLSPKFSRVFFQNIQLLAARRP